MNKKSPRYIFIAAVFLYCCFACNTEEEKSPEKFDKTKWSIKEGYDYPYRPLMLNDVLYNDTIRDLSGTEIQDLLGKPDRRNDLYLYYTISQRRIASWPLHTKTLVIKLTEKEEVDWLKIHE